jgi:uncharacterized protein with GYD domain
MPTYLVHGNYTAEAIQGLMSAGAASRVDAIKTLAESLDGSLQSAHWMLGGKGAHIMLNLPDDAAAHKVALIASSVGEVSVIRLLTAEEVDQSIGRSATFRPPGQ